MDGYQDLILTTGNEADVLDADILRVAHNLQQLVMHTFRYDEFPRLESQNLIFQQGDLTLDRSVHTVLVRRVFHTAWRLQIWIMMEIWFVINNLNESAYIFKNIGDANRVSVRLRISQTPTQSAPWWTEKCFGH